MHIHRGLLRRTTRRRVHQSQNINNVVVTLFELALSEEGKQVLVASVPVDDDYLPATVTGHFVRGLLQELKLQVSAVGDSAGLVPCFKDLPEIVLRENYRIFLFGCMQDRVAHVQQISSQRKMRSVLLDDSERKHASAARKRDGLHKIRCGQLLPVSRKFLLS